jgi:hypothetical protein
VCGCLEFDLGEVGIDYVDLRGQILRILKDAVPIAFPGFDSTPLPIQGLLVVLMSLRSNLVP